MTTVFTAYVTDADQAWVDFDGYLPKRWVHDEQRRRQAGIPPELTMKTKPELAIEQVARLVASGLPIRWAAFDEVYGRSSALRRACEDHHLPYVAIVPCDFQVTTPAGTVLRADAAIAEAVFERRSAGTGSKGPRYSDWALVATASREHHLLIRRLISRPDQYTFYLCYAPASRSFTMTQFVMIAGRRWPVEETFKIGKDVLGWDTSQVRTFNAQCRHTVLSALAGLRQVAIRNTVCGDIPPLSQPAGPQPPPPPPSAATDDITDLRILLGDAPIPTHPGQQMPPRLGLIRLSVAETARLTRLAAAWTAGLITRTQVAFALRWSARRRRHQATARWHHHATRLAHP